MVSPNSVSEPSSSTRTVNYITPKESSAFSRSYKVLYNNAPEIEVRSRNWLQKIIHGVFRVVTFSLFNASSDIKWLTYSKFNAYQLKDFTDSKLLMTADVMDICRKLIFESGEPDGSFLEKVNKKINDVAIESINRSLPGTSGQLQSGKPADPSPVVTDRGTAAPPSTINLDVSFLSRLHAQVQPQRAAESVHVTTKPPLGVVSIYPKGHVRVQANEVKYSQPDLNVMQLVDHIVHTLSMYKSEQLSRPGVASAIMAKLGREVEIIPNIQWDDKYDVLLEGSRTAKRFSLSPDQFDIVQIELVRRIPDQMARLGAAMRGMPSDKLEKMSKLDLAALADFMVTLVPKPEPKPAPKSPLEAKIDAMVGAVPLYLQGPLLRFAEGEAKNLNKMPDEPEKRDRERVVSRAVEELQRTPTIAYAVTTLLMDQSLHDATIARRETSSALELINQFFGDILSIEERKSFTFSQLVDWAKGSSSDVPERLKDVVLTSELKEKILAADVLLTLLQDAGNQVHDDVIDQKNLVTAWNSRYAGLNPESITCEMEQQLPALRSLAAGIVGGEQRGAPVSIRELKVGGTLISQLRSSEMLLEKAVSHVECRQRVEIRMKEYDKLNQAVDAKVAALQTSDLPSRTILIYRLKARQQEAQLLWQRGGVPASFKEVNDRLGRSVALLDRALDTVSGQEKVMDLVKEVSESQDAEEVGLIKDTLDVARQTKLRVRVSLAEELKTFHGRLALAKGVARRDPVSKEDPHLHPVFGKYISSFQLTEEGQGLIVEAFLSEMESETNVNALIDYQKRANALVGATKAKAAEWIDPVVKMVKAADQYRLAQDAAKHSFGRHNAEGMEGHVLHQALLATVVAELEKKFDALNKGGVTSPHEMSEYLAAAGQITGNLIGAVEQTKKEGPLTLVQQLGAVDELSEEVMEALKKVETGRVMRSMDPSVVTSVMPKILQDKFVSVRPLIEKSLAGISEFHRKGAAAGVVDATENAARFCRSVGQVEKIVEGVKIAAERAEKLIKGAEAVYARLPREGHFALAMEMRVAKQEYQAAQKELPSQFDSLRDIVAFTKRLSEVSSRFEEKLKICENWNQSPKPFSQQLERMKQVFPEFHRACPEYRQCIQHQKRIAEARQAIMQRVAVVQDELREKLKGAVKKALVSGYVDAVIDALFSRFILPQVSVLNREGRVVLKNASELTPVELEVYQDDFEIVVKQDLKESVKFIQKLKIDFEVLGDEIRQLGTNTNVLSDPMIKKAYQSIRGDFKSFVNRVREESDQDRTLDCFKGYAAAVVGLRNHPAYRMVQSGIRYQETLLKAKYQLQVSDHNGLNEYGMRTWIEAQENAYRKAVQGYVGNFNQDVINYDIDKIVANLQKDKLVALSLRNIRESIEVKLAPQRYPLAARDEMNKMSRILLEALDGAIEKAKHLLPISDQGRAVQVNEVATTFERVESAAKHVKWAFRRHTAVVNLIETLHANMEGTKEDHTLRDIALSYHRDVATLSERLDCVKDVEGYAVALDEMICSIAPKLRTF